jgi:putative oxidoreductase
VDVDLGLAILRVLVGLLFVGHGAQKLFGAFGGPGFAGTAGWFETLGLRPPRPWALIAGGGEFVGGILLALGLLGPVGGLLIAGAMLMAIAKVHGPNGLWVTNNGYEYPLVTLVVALVLAYFGPGRYALDTALGISLPTQLLFWGGLVGALIVTAVGLLSSRNPTAAPDRG